MAKNKKANFKKIVKTIFYLLLIAFLIWGMVAIIRLIIKPTNIIVVNNGEVYNGETAEGYIIRDEGIIQGEEEGEIVQIKTEGEKVAKGEVVYRYHSDDEESITKQIQDLNVQIQEALEGQTDLFSSDIKSIEAQIDSRIEGINGKNNIQNIKEYKNNISTYITKKAKIAGSLSTSESFINSLIDEKENLEKELNEKAEHIYAPESGVVSYRIDNLEDVFKADDFSYITSSFLKDLNLKTGQVIATSNNKAKIVNNYKCYIATILKSEEAQNVKINKSLKIKLSNNNIIDAKVKYKTEEAGNKTILIFEINDEVSNLIEYRKISIDVIWWEVEGLKIPKRAIYYNNGLAYVNRNRAGYIEKILIKVLEESNDYCIVDNYDIDELKKIGIPTSEIEQYKKINLYDEIILNPDK